MGRPPAENSSTGNVPSREHANSSTPGDDVEGARGSRLRNVKLELLVGTLIDRSATNSERGQRKGVLNGKDRRLRPGSGDCDGGKFGGEVGEVLGSQGILSIRRHRRCCSCGNFDERIRVRSGLRCHWHEFQVGGNIDCHTDFMRFVFGEFELIKKRENGFCISCKTQ